MPGTVENKEFHTGDLNKVKCIVMLCQTMNPATLPASYEVQHASQPVCTLSMTSFYDLINDYSTQFVLIV